MKDANALLVIGHRGASRDAPENTFAAFRLAWEDGADGIEADFRLSADGHIVCIHDAGTCRTAAVDIQVAGASLEKLRQLDVGQWKGASWAGERIPTLPGVLAAIPAGKKLFIELKSGVEIIPPLIDNLVGSGVEPEQVRILSFSATLIKEVKLRLPVFRACWLTDYRRMTWGRWRPSREIVLSTLRSAGADGLASAAKGALDDDLVAELRRAGMEIHVWTVDDPAAARRYRELGVDSIMTNRPGWLRRKLLGAPD